MTPDLIVLLTSKDSRIFEVDVHTTQQRKKAILELSNITIPETLVFVPTDFNKGELKEVLSNANNL
ncbi:MAG: class I SAM-dependent methyltransferase [Desulfobacteraceae bacterium]|jgi:O-methyltransferase involved in polyketide biosynthesis